METLALRRGLLAHYRKHARVLPWRRTSDPYAIWVSEIMLQQTQVETVRGRFDAFLRRFPDVAALARSEETTVCEAWAGLGYYRRARHLHRAARQVVDQHGGRLPSSAAGLRALAGIGAYTAAAIGSIAFQEEVAAVDGNLVRVLARAFALPGRASDAGLVERVREHAQRLVQGPRPGDVNQALMDLGATLCRPSMPLCGDCPIREHCAACRTGNPTAFPGKKRKAPRRPLRMAFAWIARAGGAAVLEQRPLDGLWPGLWELPSATGPRPKAALEARLGERLGRPLATVTHDLTHRRVQAAVYRVSCAKRLGTTWADPLAAPLSALARKAIVAVSGRDE